MNDQTDSQLLRAYAENRSEAAFTELVRRHVDFVYSAARRMVCDPHLAEDVTQGVFVAFAKNASKLTDRSVFSGWLHRTAQNIAAQTVRTIERRRAREQEAVAMNELLAHEPDAAWENIAPHLDAALGELSEADRDAVLLRYFERKSAREMAQTLNVSEEAAQKRVSRAVERLREFISKRNVTIGANGLVVLISTNAVQAAPIGLFAMISTAVSLAGIAVQTSTAIAATQTIAMTTLQKTVITVAIAAAVGTGIYETRRASTLREQVQTLQQQQAPLTMKIEQLAQERDEAKSRLAALRDDNERSNPNTGELIKLRGEVGRLKQEQSGSSTASQKQLDELKEAAQAPEMKAKTTRIMLAVSSEAGIFAHHNNGLYPTNVAELKERFSEAWLRQAGLYSSEDLGLDRFEFVPHERLLTPEDYGKLLLRERVPRRHYSTGRWVRLYTYVGGVATEAFSDDGNFDPWELQEIKHPTLKRPTANSR